MTTVTVKAEFHEAVEDVWQKVTDLDDQLWRSQLQKIERGSGKNQFIEYTPDGYQTRFTITAYEPFKRYAFDMENDNMRGNWSGLFEFANGKTTIELTENVTAKKLMMKPFVKMYLKKQQAAYVKDLEKALFDQRQNR